MRAAPSAPPSFSVRAAAALAARGVLLPSLVELLTEMGEASAASGVREAAEPVPGPLVAAPLDTWAAVAHAIGTQPVSRPRVPRWWRTNAFKHWGGCCVFCGRGLTLGRGAAAKDRARALVTARMFHLVPIALGGPDHDGAIVPACPACQHAQAMRDRADFRGTTQAEALTALRGKLALAAWNHLLEDPNDARSVPTLRKRLAARWDCERWQAYVALTGLGGFIAWPTSRPAPAGAIWGLRDLGAERLADVAGVSGMWLGSHTAALAGIWRAIGLNAWLRSVPGVAQADMFAFGPVADWHATAPSVGALLRLSRTPC